MSNPDPIEELRRLYPTILTTAHVAEMMHCTIGDVRDKVHRKELNAMRWGPAVPILPRRGDRSHATRRR